MMSTNSGLSEEPPTRAPSLLMGRGAGSVSGVKVRWTGSKRRTCPAGSLYEKAGSASPFSTNLDKKRDVQSSFEFLPLTEPP